MKSFIYFLRWIIGTLSAIASFLLLCIAVEWLIPRIFFFILPSRYYGTPLFGLERTFSDFKYFVLVNCASPIIAGFISGYLGKLICPPKHSNVTMTLFGVTLFPILAYWACLLWSSEHWMYSLTWIIALLITEVAFICSAGCDKDI